MQEQKAAKAEAYQLQTTLLDRDAALQRKDVEVGYTLMGGGGWCTGLLGQLGSTKRLEHTSSSVTRSRTHTLERILGLRSRSRIA